MTSEPPGLDLVRHRRSRASPIRSTCCGFAVCLGLLLGAPLGGQEADSIAGEVWEISGEEDGSGVWGERPERRRLIGGLWALHPFEPQFPELDWTRGFGVQVGQWFAATFVNSYEDRSFILGVERYWLRRRRGFLHAGVGYRLGLISGYDERLFAFAGDVPVLPFGGLLGWVDVGPLGVDLFYVFRAITLEGSVRF